MTCWNCCEQEFVRERWSDDDSNCDRHNIFLTITYLVCRRLSSFIRPNISKKFRGCVRMYRIRMYLCCRVVFPWVLNAFSFFSEGLIFWQVMCPWKMLRRQGTHFSNSWIYFWYLMIYQYWTFQTTQKNFSEFEWKNVLACILSRNQFSITCQYILNFKFRNMKDSRQYHRLAFFDSVRHSRDILMMRSDIEISSSDTCFAIFRTLALTIGFCLSQTLHVRWTTRHSAFVRFVLPKISEHPRSGKRHSFRRLDDRHRSCSEK